MSASLLGQDALGVDLNYGLKAVRLPAKFLALLFFQLVARVLALGDHFPPALSLSSRLL
jgi:hypothetical protein